LNHNYYTFVYYAVVSGADIVAYVYKSRFINKLQNGVISSFFAMKDANNVL